MSISDPHPKYIEQELDWKVARDTIEGERAVKFGQNLIHYLPVPPGMAEGVTTYFTLDRELSPQRQKSRYAFYASFAQFPEIVAPTIDAFMGLVDEKPPHIELPAKMQYLMEMATPSGESLPELWQTTMREILSAGRISFLPDVLEDTDQIVLVPYKAEALINWAQTTKRQGSKIQLSVLRETSTELQEDYSHQDVVQYRELAMRNGTYQVRTWSPDSSDQLTAGDWVTPMLFGAPLSVDSVPIIVGNSYGIGLRYGRIPIIPISRIAVRIFRGTADYYRSLYVKGDPQYYISGLAPNSDEVPTIIGGSEIWCFSDAGVKPGILDLDGDGIPHQRQAIEDLYNQFVAAAGRLLEHTARAGQESGVAVGKRLTAQHVTLASVTKEAGSAVLAALQNVAKILGEDPMSVRFEPNLDFTESEITGQEMMQLIASKNTGYPISERSLHGIARRRGATMMTYEEEKALIEQEEPVVPVTPPAPTASEPDDDEP